MKRVFSKLATLLAAIFILTTVMLLVPVSSAYAHHPVFIGEVDFAEMSEEEIQQYLEDLSAEVNRQLEEGGHTDKVGAYPFAFTTIQMATSQVQALEGVGYVSKSIDSEGSENGETPIDRALAYRSEFSDLHTSQPHNPSVNFQDYVGFIISGGVLGILLERSRRKRRK